MAPVGHWMWAALGKEVWNSLGLRAIPEECLSGEPLAANTGQLVDESSGSEWAPILCPDMLYKVAVLDSTTSLPSSREQPHCPKCQLKNHKVHKLRKAFLKSCGLAGCPSCRLGSVASDRN